MSKKKQVAFKFFNNYKVKDPLVLKEVFHEDFGNIHKMKKIHSKVTDPSNPSVSYFKFLELIDFPKSQIEKGKKLIQYSTKAEAIEYHKWMWQFYKELIVNDLIEEGDKVYAYVDIVFYNQTQEVVLGSYYTIHFKENQILAYTGAGLYLQTILNYGNVVFDRGSKEEIAKYIEKLKNMGLLPGTY